MTFVFGAETVVEENTIDQDFIIISRWYTVYFHTEYNKDKRSIIFVNRRLQIKRLVLRPTNINTR